jgi:hypothetical protein
MTTEDYYGMFAFFHNVPETGRAIRDGNSEPYILAPTWLQQGETAAIGAISRHKQHNEVRALQPTIDRAWSAGRKVGNGKIKSFH